MATAIRLGYLPSGTDASMSPDTLLLHLRNKNHSIPSWLQKPYYLGRQNSYFVRGTAVAPYPLDAIEEHRMHQTKLAAIRDPDPCFDALRRAFFIPVANQCSATGDTLWEVAFEERNDNDECCNEGLLHVADQLHALGKFYDSNGGSFLNEPADFRNYALDIYLRALATPGHAYYLSAQEILTIAKLCGEPQS